MQRLEVSSTVRDIYNFSRLSVKEQTAKTSAASCANRKFYIPSLTDILSHSSPVRIIVLYVCIVY